MKKESQKTVLTNLSQKVLFLLKTDLLLNLPYMSRALDMLPFIVNFKTRTWGSDGNAIYYNPNFITQNFLDNKPLLIRGYMQILIHCIFCHIYVFRDYENRELFDLCCDICAEYIIDGIDNETLYRLSSDYRDKVYNTLESEVEILTPNKVYEYYKGNIDYNEFQKLSKELVRDDHSFWEDSPNNKNNMPPESSAENQWKKAAKKMQEELMLGRDASGEVGRLERTLRATFKSKTDYRDFLKKYTVYREELQTDPENFDFGLYMYGLEIYKNMPIIEENEFLETKKIENIVIAIDTSASCQGELVKKFINETGAILLSSQSFFKRSQIVIIECDNQIQNVIRLKNAEDIKAYSDNFIVAGGYGTDFRPVFNYVSDLQKSGEIKNLKGLIYFTDGFGEFPQKKTAYETSFVLTKDGAEEEARIPDWAHTLYF